VAMVGGTCSSGHVWPSSLSDVRVASSIFTNSASPPTWEAAGALDEHRCLTALGRWGLPRALSWAWGRLRRRGGRIGSIDTARPPRRSRPTSTRTRGSCSTWITASTSPLRASLKEPRRLARTLYTGEQQNPGASLLAERDRGAVRCSGWSRLRGGAWSFSTPRGPPASAAACTCAGGER
jgi:hypothetical protein